MMMEIINAKLDEGYELINEGEHEIGDHIRALEYKKVYEEEKKEEPRAPAENPKPSSAQVAKLVTVADEIWDYIDEIDAKAVELNVRYEPMSGRLQLAGNETAVNELIEFIGSILLCLKPADIQPDNMKQGEERKEEEEEKEIDLREKDSSEENGDNLGLYIQKELVLYPNLKPHLKEIVTQAEKMQLIYEDLDNKLLIVGFQTQVIDFMTWMYNFTAIVLENAMTEQKKMKYSRMNSEFKQDEIAVSTFHRIKKTEILKYAEDLELICDFGYDVILVTGDSEIIKEFKSYLHEIEAKAKKSLYPKYWDFHNIDIFSEIEIHPLAEEFQEVEILLLHTLPNAIVHKLTRIQNKYLMDHYVTMLQKRQELRPDGIINRKLLFHGTRTIKPEEIYRNSDTGFDLQFANTSGAYGKGLYFASGANYSHNGYVYNLGNGRFQMILADVFVGNAYKSNPNSSLKKAPAGYDSVESTTHNFYVVYNNFHSYPLYLIEYECSGGNSLNRNNLFGIPTSGVKPNNGVFLKPKTALVNNFIPHGPANSNNPIPLFGQQQQQQQQANLFQNKGQNQSNKKEVSDLFNNLFSGNGKFG